MARIHVHDFHTGMRRELKWSRKEVVFGLTVALATLILHHAAKPHGARLTLAAGQSVTITRHAPGYLITGPGERAYFAKDIYVNALPVDRAERP